MASSSAAFGLLGAYCRAVGALLAALGLLWGRFWALLGFSSPLLGCSWTLLGASWLPNAVQEGPGLDFGGFWERPGRVSEVPRLYFSLVFRTFRYIMLLIVQ